MARVQPDADHQNVDDALQELLNVQSQLDDESRIIASLLSEDDANDELDLAFLDRMIMSTRALQTIDNQPSRDAISSPSVERLKHGEPLPYFKHAWHALIGRPRQPHTFLMESLGPNRAWRKDPVPVTATLRLTERHDENTGDAKTSLRLTLKWPDGTVKRFQRQIIPNRTLASAIRTLRHRVEKDEHNLRVVEAPTTSRKRLLSVR